MNANGKLINCYIIYVVLKFQFLICVSLLDIILIVMNGFLRAGIIVINESSDSDEERTAKSHKNTIASDDTKVGLKKVSIDRCINEN